MQYTLGKSRIGCVQTSNLVGETKRAIRCSTDSESQKLSLKLIKQLFIDNGYPIRFVKGVVRSTLFERRQQCESQEEFLYFKLPFINQEYTRRALSVLNNVNTVYERQTVI